MLIFQKINKNYKIFHLNIFPSSQVSTAAVGLCLSSCQLEGICWCHLNRHHRYCHHCHCHYSHCQRHHYRHHKYYHYLYLLFLFCQPFYSSSHPQCGQVLKFSLSGAGPHLHYSSKARWVLRLQRLSRRHPCKCRHSTSSPFACAIVWGVARSRLKLDSASLFWGWWTPGVAAGDPQQG